MLRHDNQLDRGPGFYRCRTEGLADPPIAIPDTFEWTRIASGVDHHTRRRPANTVIDDRTPETKAAENDAMIQSNERDLAWDLVEQARSCLSIAELNTVFIRLGAAEYWIAIEIVLTAAARTRETLPQELIAGLTAWLDVYHGNPDHPGLRSLLAKCTAPDKSNEGDV